MTLKIRDIELQTQFIHLRIMIIMPTLKMSLKNSNNQNTTEHYTLKESSQNFPLKYQLSRNIQVKCNEIFG